MKKPRTQVEKELEGKAKEVIQRLLDWNDAHPMPDLTQIENVALELREALGSEFASSVLSNQKTAEPVMERCPSPTLIVYNRKNPISRIASRL